MGPPRPARNSGFNAPEIQKLGLPPRQRGSAGFGVRAAAAQSDPRPPGAAGQGLERIDDPALRDLLAAVAAHWGALDDYGRGHFLADLWAAGGSGLRAQGSGIEHVVAWLGWKVIEGGREGRDDGK